MSKGDTGQESRRVKILAIHLLHNVELLRGLLVLVSASLRGSVSLICGPAWAAPGFEVSSNRSCPHTTKALQVSTTQRPPFTELIPYPLAPMKLTRGILIYSVSEVVFLLNGHFAFVRSCC